MRILVISQYFFPENFRINDLVFSLSSRGHYVEVLTGKPNYPFGEYFEGYSWKSKDLEEINGVLVHRANLFLRKKGTGIRLFFNYLSFIFFGVFKLLKVRGKFDKIFIYAPSPITVGFLGIIASKKFKCKSYLWVHDLWPESVKVAGKISNSIILFMVDLMTKLIYRFTDYLLVQSPRFKIYMKKQGVSENKIIYYPYYAEDFYKVVERQSKYQKFLPEGFNILFAGNVGVAQSFDTIINAFELIKDYNINLVIIGDGRDKERIQKLIKIKGLESKIVFLGSFPAEIMPYFFACSDALLISLKKSDIFSYTIPGKLQSYLACGRPIIGSLDGIGNQIISDSNSGYCSKAEDSLELSKNILRLFKDSDISRSNFSQNALLYFENNFKKNKLLTRLEEIFSQ